MKLLLLCAVLVIAGCTSPYSTPIVSFSTSTGEVQIPVEIADSPDEWYTGLMNRDHLKGGMLFIFSDTRVEEFWMKNTIIPLDILFLDEERRVVTIAHALPCTVDPCDRYSSIEPVRYVLEVNAGVAEKEGILPGAIATFSGI